MRNGSLVIPSMMMSFGNGSSQKSVAFDIQKNNLFMGPKRPIMKVKTLTSDQKIAINKKLNEYKSIDTQRNLLAIGLTTLISTSLLFIFFL